MSPATYIIFFSLIGSLLFFAELFLPAHGVLGVLGVLCFVAVVVTCFIVSRWLGVGVGFAMIVATPFLFAGVTNAWERTPLGRKMILTKTSGNRPVPPTPAVLVGTIGRAVTELRPMGEIEFGDSVVQGVSETGLAIGVGTRVKVISIYNAVATVRPAGAVAAENPSRGRPVST